MIVLKPLIETPIEIHLQYLEEWFNIGEEFAISELLRSYDIIDYDNQRNDYQIYSIYIDNIYAGVIGYESYTIDPKSCWLAWTLIIPEFRGQGYGKVAFNKLMDIMKDKGYKNFFIDSVEDNNTQEFYKKIGFEHLGDCKKFRETHPWYSKEILIYNNNPVYLMKLT